MQTRSLKGVVRGVGMVLIALLTCGFAAGVFGLVYSLTSPEGEAVGTMVADGQSAVYLTASPGDTLHFTLSYSFPITGFGLFDSPARENAIHKALRTSSLRVVARSPTGAPVETTCAPYNGRTGSVSEVGHTRSLSGALTDCVITIPSAGEYSVVGSVTWSPAVHARSVAIDVRKAAPSR